MDLLFMAASLLPEQTIADIRDNIQKHMQTNEHKRAYRENNQTDLGIVRDGMERLVCNRGNEFLRGALMALVAGLDLILAGYGRRRILGAFDIV
jgi:hypothetical protein